ncbi:hypothetical protein OKW21_002166 [Catalinimonas alkaloidigena]|uniref:DUF7793 family protein n=1 Tax=Catalinimonas alkaloidigena TaxID=1075417 RepID=UPI0024067F85|nr:hypothetical protein [Catalinimonas alkaloidigena]MDF9796903.1 hypothetical protein [Catalinimonas alkaloidigena]
MNHKKFENDYFYAELNDDIVTVQYKPNLHLKLDDAKRIVSERLEYFGDLKTPVLIKSSRIKSIDKQAREYLFSEGLINITAIALVETSTVEKVLTTIVFNFNKPKIPHKVFSDNQDAIKWLRKFL